MTNNNNHSMAVNHSIKHSMAVNKTYHTIYCGDCKEYSIFMSKSTSIEFMVNHKCYNKDGNDNIQPIEEILDINVIEVF